MTTEEKYIVYYAILRRFPPKTTLFGEELDKYCTSMLKHENIRNKIMLDLDKALYTTSAEDYGLGYNQNDYQE